MKSNAGKYESISNVRKASLFENIKQFIELNDKMNYEGDIIIQTMLPYEFCGVAVTGDKNLDNEGYINIEICLGPINLITEGKEIAARVIYDLVHDEYISIEYFKEIMSQRQINLNLLISNIKKAEVLFGQKADIEWGIYKENIYIYQIRKIVNEGCNK